jgi:hypothetical protein
MTSQQSADIMLAEYREAKFRLAVARSDALFEFYSAERRAGADALTANGLMHEHAKYLDGSDYARDLDVVRRCMESK